MNIVNVVGKLDSTLQSPTGKYRGLQGNPCNENRDPVMRTGVPCNENRFFSVGIDSQGVPCELYRGWVCSVSFRAKNSNLWSNLFSRNKQIFCPLMYWCGDKIILWAETWSSIFEQTLVLSPMNWIQRKSVNLLIFPALIIILHLVLLFSRVKTG